MLVLDSHSTILPQMASFITTKASRLLPTFPDVVPIAVVPLGCLIVLPLSLVLILVGLLLLAMGSATT